MKILIDAIVFLATYSNPVVPMVSVCDKTLDHLNYKTQIEISIGCSTVDSVRVNSERYLEELYNE